MNSARRLVVVTGPSGAGKTTLARALGRKLALSVFHKDDLKETLFDALPDSSPEERARFGIASFVMLERIARAVLPNGSAIVEANFDGRIASAKWREIVVATGVQARVIILEAPAKVLTERIRRRAHDGSRHPGHISRAANEDAISLLPLDLGVPTLLLEATQSPDELLTQALDWLKTDPPG